MREALVNCPLILEIQIYRRPFSTSLEQSLVGVRPIGI